MSTLWNGAPLIVDVNKRKGFGMMDFSLASASIRADILTFAVGSFVSLFSVVNPVMAAPVFVSLTDEMNAEEKAQLAKGAAINIGIILLVFFLLGSFILGLFGISINALRIAGGLMVLTNAYNMLNKKERLLPEEKAEAADRDDMAFSPLAMPLMSGPGSIAIIIGMTSNVKFWLDYGVIMAVILVVAFFCYITMRLADPLVNRCGKTMVKAFTRMMGFILLCVGVQMIAVGVQSFLRATLTL